MKILSTVVPCMMMALSSDAFVSTPKSHRSAASAITILQESKSPLDMFGGIGETLSKEIGSLLKSKEDTAVKAVEEKEAKPTIPDVVIDSDYKLGAIFLAGGILLDLIPYIQLTLGPFVTLLGILFVVQTARLRFCFDDTSFELRTTGGDENEGNLGQTGENIVVGGENRWTYDSFVNYDFFPEGWIDQPQGPILVYFKETQTPSENWNDGPGQSANSPEALANGAKPGQVHFFPAICNSKQLRDEFARRGCAKL
ncbi:Protein of unknown function (DUF3119) [Seminavis robusta]|uniref:Uncharacterized protein n=1 Tax=Seminavis robusta TaxID=568900 RepID=A0A9N8E823_9STRA|nr:Protein of unknown function (DUF3119) [Seminavis robusta]|eukprot:Sro647_g180940.1 Protein of unknown function (DUF3119) (255) ;mRNA; f:38025-38789